jgi:hypothetical protein
VTPRIGSLVRIGLTLPLALSALTSSAVATTHGSANSAAHAVVTGADVSWPNCPKGEGIPSRRSKGEPMPKPSARFVVLGVTNGPGFHPNPCLAKELSWVNRHHRLIGGYALTTYPTPQEIARHGSTGPFQGGSGRAALRNTGYAEAAYNVRTIARVGLAVQLIWVDIEPYPVAPWSHHRAANRAVIAGVIRGYHDLGYQVGLYTYANGWRDVVGAWRLPKLPTWSTAGRSHKKHALTMCTHGPSGGQTWIAQWWRTKKHDYDVTCPGTSPPFTEPTSSPGQ